MEISERLEVAENMEKRRRWKPQSLHSIRFHVWNAARSNGSQKPITKEQAMNIARGLKESSARRSSTDKEIDQVLDWIEGKC
jgi:hypothetical protein